MIDTITRYLNQIKDGQDRLNLLAVIKPIADRLSTCTLNSAGLVIKAGGSALVKTGATPTAVSVKGKLQSIAAATDMAALSGTVVNATFNVYAFFVDAAGTLTSAMGTAGATLGAVVFPAIPEGKALIGYTIINPTGTGDYVGGTTALDDVTVVPNAVHVSVVGGFDPSILL